MRLIAPKEHKKNLAARQEAMFKEGSQTMAALKHGQMTLVKLQDEIARLHEEKTQILEASIVKYQELITPLENEVAELTKERERLLEPLDAVVEAINAKQAELDKRIAEINKKEEQLLAKEILQTNIAKGLLAREITIANQEDNLTRVSHETGLKHARAIQIEQDALAKEETITAQLNKRTEDLESRLKALELKEINVEAQRISNEEEREALKRDQVKLKSQRAAFEAVYAKNRRK